jgi:hypothetical protein
LIPAIVYWYYVVCEVMVRGTFIQRPMLRDVVVARVGCVLLLDGYGDFVPGDKVDGT